MPVFLAPLYLIGAALAAAPVIMHLLQRRKPRPVPFSSVRFLQAAVARTRRSRRITQVLTLLMRVLILLLVALAFARPKLRFAQWLPEGSRTVVIILDGSASMQVRHGDGTSFEVARAWAADLLSSLDEADRAAVVVPGISEEEVVFPPISDHSGIVRALEETEPGYGEVTLAASLRDVLKRLEFGKGYTGLEVHVFSDFQSSGWDSGLADDLNGLIAGKDLALFFNRVRPPQVPNAGFEKVLFNPPALVGDRDLRIKSYIRSSRDFSGEDTLHISIDEETRGTRTFALGSGAATNVSFPVRVDSAGDSVTGVLELGQDSYALDNTFYFSLPRVSGVPVLVVGGRDAGTEHTDTFFLETAMQPGSRTSTILSPEHADWASFLGQSLMGYDIVLVSNPPELAGAAAAKLAGFASNGGVVIVFPGEALANVESVKALPGYEAVTVESQSTPESVTKTLLPSSPPTAMEEKVLRVLPKPFEVILNRRLVITGIPDAATPFLAYDDESPFIVTMPHDHGSVTVCSVSATRDWTEWPLSPLFVVTVQELLKRATQRNLAPRMTDVGSILALEWPGEDLAVEFAVRYPTGESEVLTVSRARKQDPLLFSCFSQPGLYTLSRGNERYRIAVNVPSAESDFEYLAEEKLASDLRSASLYQAASWEEQRTLLGNVRHGRPLWPLLLIVVFLLAIAEELFANYQSRAQELPQTLRHLLAGGKA
ncbi:MAG: BatA domain-containing protein [Candidatus Pacebacteria bacterium]|nr:BatA domain-containing protein [Candidatus Paceibacterota bacterium]